MPTSTTPTLATPMPSPTPTLIAGSEAVFVIVGLLAGKEEEVVK